MTKKKYERPQGSLISYMSNKVKQYGGINFAQGIPGFKPPIELTETLSQIHNRPVHQYAPGLGNLHLRELILNKYKTYNYTSDQLLITQGATEAISLIIIYLKNKIDNNFSAMAFDPVYESYRHLPRIMNIPFHAYDKAFQINDLRSFILENNIKVIFINSPGNPLGYVYTKDEMDSLRALCESLNVYMIIDAVYKELWYENPIYYPIDNLSKNIFYVNSFSKSLSITGWRIGYFFAHESHATQIRDIHDYIGLCVNSPLQEALREYLDKHDFGSAYIEEIRNTLRKNYFEMSESLKHFNVQIENAAGGYYIWAKLPNETNGFQFTMELYNKSKVAVIPGIHFSDKAISHIRINIARPENEILEGINKIDQFFNP